MLDLDDFSAFWGVEAWDWRGGHTPDNYLQKLGLKSKLE